MVVLDLDKGEDIDAIRSSIRSKQLYAIIYSTYSHLTTETEIKLDDYIKFTGDDVSVDGLKSYLVEKRGLPERFVDAVSVVDKARYTSDGVVCVAGHAPLPKYRVVFPLREPFRRRDLTPEGWT